MRKALEMEAPKITREEILSLAANGGSEWAYNLLLLGGPDWYAGNYTEYWQFLEELEGGASK